MILVLLIVFLCSVQACVACTGVYVGSDVSEDGSAMFARSNDLRGINANHITVTPAVENESGRYMPVSEDTNMQTEIPATTYKYISTPYMNSTTDDNEVAHDAACGANEYGVVMTMSITAYPNQAAVDADTPIESGLCEDASVDLVICQSKTAREGVEVLCGIIDEFGSSESNIAFIADQTEAWYVEIYTAHQYAAVKLPKDKVSVFGNEFSLEYLSDFEEYIISNDLLSLPEEKGFAVYGRNNELNLLDTYSRNETLSDYSHMRTWIGHQLLAPSQFSEDYNISTRYPLCFTPDKKVSIQDVAEIMRNRFEETEYSPDETGRTDMRVIGTDTALSVHILQVYPDLPAEMSCVNWVSSGPAVYGVFIPVSNDCINVSEVYGADQPLSEKGVFDTDNYPYYLFKDICTRCVGPQHYKIYGEPVQAYWQEAESYMFDGMSEVLKKAAEIEDETARANYITSYCNDMQTKAFEDGKQILNDVTLTQSKNSNTYDNGRVIPQMEINLNASKYKGVPDLDNITVIASDFVKVFRNESQFYATFLDSKGKYLAKGTAVTFNLNGIDYIRTVGENGSAKININLNAGNYQITSANPVTGKNQTNNITVISKISENRNINKYYKNATQYTVKLIGDDGNPVSAGETVTFNINGVFYNRTTDEYGVAILNINLAPGNYIITAEYNECKASNNITVLPVLSANNLTKKYGTDDQFTAALLDGQGNPLAGAIVTFNINGIFYFKLTDSSGEAKLNINLMAGEYIITSSYNGTSIANKITVTS